MPVSVKPVSCLFCGISLGSVPSATVYRDANTVAFLDHKPLFAGHVLVIPARHYETLGDLPGNEVGLFFEVVQGLSRVIPETLGAEGTFVAINNRVSQSVPHLHAHVVPRKKGDGLKGFFWPRKKYGSDEEQEDVRRKIERAMEEILPPPAKA